MKEKQARIFTLTEANELVKEVATVTKDVVRELEKIRQRYQIEPGQGSEAMPQPAIKEIEDVLNGWAGTINELGALPKGYFTVDFQSREPELLYCWTYGEERIEFTHKVWENFNHRRPLAQSMGYPEEHLKWVN
jgi:hypothetical protein